MTLLLKHAVRCIAACAVGACTLSAANAQTSPALDHACQAQANNAKLIAQDRDSGVSKEAEWQKAQGVISAMPPERQVYAQSELSMFIERLYGRYANMPPPEVYQRYLAFCEKQAGHNPG